MTSAMNHQHLPAALRAPSGDEIIDVKDGLDRIMGDRDLYARMLRRFRKDYTGGDQPIRAAVAAGDATVSHRLAHTMKGAAGMIGARTLHHEAAALESSLRTESAASSDAIGRVADALADALDAIDRLLEESPAAPAHAPTAHMADAALLAQLLDLLANGDGAAIDLLEDSEANLRSVIGDERYDEVAAAANEFDYERALASLRRDAGSR